MSKSRKCRLAFVYTACYSNYGDGGGRAGFQGCLLAHAAVCMFVTSASCFTAVLTQLAVVAQPMLTLSASSVIQGVLSTLFVSPMRPSLL